MVISAEAVQLIRPDGKLLDETYSISVKRRVAVYDAVFVALALELGLDLKTFDSKQSTIMPKEERT